MRIAPFVAALASPSSRSDVVRLAASFIVFTAALAAAAPAVAQRTRLKFPIEELETRARLDSCDSRALYDLAIGYLAAERYDASDSLLRRAVALDPQFAVGYFALGLVKDRDERFWRELRRRGGDTAVASERSRRASWTRKAFLVDPFVDVRLMGAVNRHREYGSYFGMALNAFVEGNYNGAYNMTGMVIDYVRRQVASRDSLPPVLLWMHALAAARASHYRDAITDLEILIRLDQAREADSTRSVPLRTNEYRYMLAAVHQRMQQNTLSIRLYEQVLANDIGNYMAHVQLARIYEAERSWFDAVRERRLAVEVNPEDHSLLYDLGATLAAASRWQEAEEPLLRASAIEPRHFGTQRVLGIVQQEVGKKSEARLTLARYLALAPSRDTTGIADARRRLEALGPETSP